MIDKSDDELMNKQCPGNFVSYHLKTQLVPCLNWHKAFYIGDYGLKIVKSFEIIKLQLSVNLYNVKCAMV